MGETESALLRWMYADSHGHGQNDVGIDVYIRSYDILLYTDILTACIPAGYSRRPTHPHLLLPLLLLLLPPVTPRSRLRLLPLLSQNAQ